MKAIVNTKDFARILNQAVRCIDVKPTIPILSHFLIEIEEGRVQVTGTDLDMTFRSRLKCEGGFDFAGCVEGKFLTALLGKISDETVTLSLDGSRLSLAHSKGKSTLQITVAEQFPQIPELNDDSGDYDFRFMTGAFVGAINFCVIATEDDRISSTAKSVARLTVAPDLIDTDFQIVATDERILSVVDGICERSETAGDQPLFLPRQVLIKLPTVLSGFGPSFYLKNNDKSASIFAGEHLYIFRKSSYQLPNVSVITDREFPIVFKTSIADIRDGIGRLSLCSGDRKFAFDFSAKELVINGASASAAGREEVAGELEGIDSFKASYDANYLSSVINKTRDAGCLSFFEDSRYSIKTYPLKVTTSIKGMPVKAEFYLQGCRF